MRYDELNQIEYNKLPRNKMSCEVLGCYICLGILGVGTYVISFFGGYHLRETEDNNTTFFDRG